MEGLLLTDQAGDVPGLDSEVKRLDSEAKSLDSEAKNSCPVNSHNEWDPLEEVIVGRLEGATIPSYHISFAGNLPRTAAKLYRPIAGRKYPRPIVDRAMKELDGFVALLEGEGITVRRPEITDFSREFSSPDWKSKGFCTASPRDVIIVFGDEFLETPGSWRSRIFEVHAYRPLLLEYFEKGAKWMAAPKPMLRDSFFDLKFRPSEEGEPVKYIINETEPTFDAADFVRCGRDIFYTRSNATNASGVKWIERHYGDRYNFHQVISHCRLPLHIDTTFMPLAPGKVLINPSFVKPEELPPILGDWDILIAPEPDPVTGLKNYHLSLVSPWISLNVLMLDEKRVVVEASQKRMIKAMKEWGLEPIPCPFLNYKIFGGGFHCATLDIRRRGELQSYF